MIVELKCVKEGKKSRQRQNKDQCTSIVYSGDKSNNSSRVLAIPLYLNALIDKRTKFCFDCG